MTHGQIHQWAGDSKRSALICLHGFMGTGQDYEILADNYSRHPTIIAPNFPDYLVEPIPVDDSWTAALNALDCLVDHASKDRPCALVGYSMGGRIALNYTLANQSKLTALVLIGATPGLSKKKRPNRSKKQRPSPVRICTSQTNRCFLKDVVSTRPHQIPR